MKTQIMAKRVALIPEELISSYQLQKPESKVVQEIDALLEQSKLPDDMKVKLLGQLVNRYHRIVHAPVEPVKVSVTTDNEASSPKATENEEPPEIHEGDAIMRDIMLSTPQRYSKFVPMIAEKLKSRHFSWNDLGELTLDNKPIRGSKVVDLFSYLMRNLKVADEPPHVDVFLRAIKEINIPRTWIANKKVLQKLNDTSNSGDFYLKLNKKIKKRRTSFNVSRKLKKFKPWVDYP